MLIFRVLGFAAIFIGLFLIFTQIVLPGVRGRPLFPLFRSKTPTLESQLAQVKQDADEALLEREVREAAAKVEAIVKGTDSNPNSKE